MMPVGPRKATRIALAALTCVVAIEAQATPIVTAWNSRDLSGDRNFSHRTFERPWGFSTPEIDDLVSDPISAVGLVDSGHATALIFNNAPTSYSPNYYLDFVVTPKAGMKFDPGYFRVASSKNIAPKMQFELRTSLDNFTTLVGTSAFNNATTRNGGSYTDIEVDLSALPDITSEVTFRLYFKDNDGVISAVGSTATWPYGWQLYGDSLEVPEPSSLALLGLGGLLFTRRRR